MRLRARSSGFLVGVDGDAAASAARRAGVVVRLCARTGDSVVIGTPMAHARATDTPGAVHTDELEETLDGAVRLDFERSADRDVAYGLRKIINIAVRGLSPGINNPTTAVHALSRESALLGELAVRPVEDRAIRDGEGAVRVVLPAGELPALVHLVLEEPVQFAEGQPAVLRRLAGLLRELAWRARGRGVDALVRRCVDQIAGTAVRTSGVPEEEAKAWRQHVAQALAGQWPAEGTGTQRVASSWDPARRVLRLPADGAPAPGPSGARVAG